MWDLVVHYIYLTRDIIWLKRMFYSKSSQNTLQYYVINMSNAKSEARENNPQTNVSNQSETSNSDLNIYDISDNTALQVIVGGEQV